MRLREKDFYDHVEHALNDHFPKGKCKERSQALMVFSTAVLAHGRIVDEARKHLGNLLAIMPDTERNTAEYTDARKYFTE